jgi:hypothetical protein
MNGVFAFLNASVTKYGGAVAGLLGDAVLAFFRAPVAHEDDLERAVRAGLDVRAAAREYAEMIKRNYEVDVSLRTALDYYRRNHMRPYLARVLHSLACWYAQQGRGAEAAPIGQTSRSVSGQESPG